MSAISTIDKTFEKWGVDVAKSELVPGRPGSFTPHYVMVHHTASSKSGGANPSARTVRVGRSDLPGPLCQILVRRDNKVEIVTHGRANHAGVGHWPAFGSNGNTMCVGVEIEHCGTSDEPWTDAYMEFCRLVVAAICDHLNAPASHVLAHKEFAPSRKIDPYKWDMDSERKWVDRLLDKGPSPKTDEPKDDDMNWNDKIKLTAKDAEAWGGEWKEGDEVSIGQMLRYTTLDRKNEKRLIAIEKTLKELVELVKVP